MKNCNRVAYTIRHIELLSEVRKKTLKLDTKIVRMKNWGGIIECRRPAAEAGTGRELRRQFCPALERTAFIGFRYS